MIFAAAGGTGIGVYQAAKDAGKYAIGVDSNQNHIQPGTMLTSMVKRVDLAVYEAARDVAKGTFTASDIAMGLKEGAVAAAEVRNDFPGKTEALAKVEQLRAQVVAGAQHRPDVVHGLLDLGGLAGAHHHRHRVAGAVLLVERGERQQGVVVARHAEDGPALRRHP